MIHSAHLRSDEVEWVDDLLVTVATRMVADLCAATLDGEHLAGVIADLLGKRLTTQDELAVALAPFATRYGAQTRDGREFLDYLLSFAP